MTATVPVITIDGPGGAGKGTLCKAMAETLGWHLLDSGAIYRVLALAALHHHVDVESEEALVPLAAHLDVRFVSTDGSTEVVLEGRMLALKFALRMLPTRHLKWLLFLACVKHCSAASEPFANCRA